MEIWRGGVTAKRIKQEDGYAYVGKGGAYKGDNRPGIHFTFPLPSKGGGTTQAKLWISPEEFSEIASEMIAAAPDAARKAMLEALLYQADPGRKQRERRMRTALRAFQNSADRAG